MATSCRAERRLAGRRAERRSAKGRAIARPNATWHLQPTARRFARHGSPVTRHGSLGKQAPYFQLFLRQIDPSATIPLDLPRCQAYYVQVEAVRPEDRVPGDVHVAQSMVRGQLAQVPGAGRNRVGDLRPSASDPRGTPFGSSGVQAGVGRAHPTALDPQPARPSPENAQGRNPPRGTAHNMSQNHERRSRKIGNMVPVPIPPRPPPMAKPTA